MTPNAFGGGEERDQLRTASFLSLNLNSKP